MKFSYSLVHIFFLLLFSFIVMLFITDQSQVIINLDYYQDYFASAALLEGSSIYQPIFYDNWIIQNAHPPITSILFLPFTIFSVKNGYIVYNFLSYLLIGSSLVFIARYFKISPGYRLTLLTVCLLWPPVLEIFRYGQVNSLVLFCCIQFLTQIETKHQNTASLFLGLAMALKFFPALFCLGLLKHRKYKQLFLALLTFMVLNVISYVVIGAGDFNYYYQTISKTNTARYILFDNNISIPAFVGTFFLHVPQSHPVEFLPNLAYILIVGATSALLLFDLFNQSKLKEQLLYLSLVMTLVTPIMWDHFLLITIPSIIFLLLNRPRNSILHFSWLVTSVLIMSIPSFFIRSIYLNLALVNQGTLVIFQVLLAKIQGVGLIMLIIYFMVYLYKKYGFDWNLKLNQLASGEGSRPENCI